MNFEQFAAEAERLGLVRVGEIMNTWRSTDDGLVIRCAHDGDEILFASAAMRSNTPADALREAARLIHGDVAGKMREWLEATIAGCPSVGSDAVCPQCGALRCTLAKLDELEGIK